MDTSSNPIDFISNSETKNVMIEEGEISIDPQIERVRVYSKWKREDKLEFDPQFFQVIERIAKAIKKLEL